jgi:hypothetical protein
MCSPELLKAAGGSTANTRMAAAGSLGKRLDQAQRQAQATAGGGTATFSQNILDGLPRTDPAGDRVRKTLLTGVS